MLFVVGCGSPAGPEPTTASSSEAAAPAPEASSAPTEPDYRRGPQAARATTQEHLCEDAESVVFTCTLQGGVGLVSVCGVRVEGGAWDLTARYATQETPEIVAPGPLRYGRTEGASVTRTALAFSVEGTAYEIQASYEHDTSCYQVFVLAPDQTDRTLPCTGPVFDQIGGLAAQGLTVEPYWR
jgi:hypothetical protein